MHKLLKRTMAIVIGAALCLAGVGCSGEKETISGGWNDIVINEGKPVTRSEGSSSYDQYRTDRTAAHRFSFHSGYHRRVLRDVSECNGKMGV